MPPPSHPPRNRAQQPQLQLQTPYNIAYNVTEALRDPYAQASLNQFYNPYSSHYASAYMKSQQVIRRTPEGYTLSSTYDPNKELYTTRDRGNNHQLSPPIRGRGGGQVHNSHRALNQPRQSNNSWYYPGNLHCNYPRCTFSGSHKSVELHMMDRHLIYPPNLDGGKKGSDWDTDPSLKGKIIPIQGTSIVLNTPEAVEAWVAERKRRWPTAQRVEEKKKKLEEAIARGQLPLVRGDLRGSKRQREGGQCAQRHNKRPQRPTTRQENKPAPPPTRETPGYGTGGFHRFAPSSSTNTARPAVECPKNDESDSDDDGPPENVSSKSPDGYCPPNPLDETKRETAKVFEARPHSFSSAQVIQPRRKMPRLPPRNPFASQPALLRNLLLPEIRMTISNLSQAIRFLVDNDFLQNVELNPGDTSQNLIEVLDSQSTNPIGH